MFRLYLSIPFAAIMLILAGGLASCSQPDPRTYFATPDDRRHWVQNERLRAIMSRLDREPLASWPQGIEDEYAGGGPLSKERWLAEAGALAGALSVAAVRIPEMIRDVPMTYKERRAFLSQVGVLREQAATLADAAGMGHLDMMRTVLSSINATCKSCHWRFRDYSGPLAQPSRLSINGHG